MTRTQIATAIAYAIKRLANDHGVPNAFAPSEIAVEARVRSMQVGTAMRYDRTFLNGLLACEGIAIVAYNSMGNATALKAVRVEKL